MAKDAKDTKDTQDIVKPPKMLMELAEAAGMDATRYFNVIIRTVLKKRDRDRRPVMPSTEEVYAFLMVCRRYNLDPLLKQIHGFVGKDGQIVPIVGIDGWVKTSLNNENYVTHRTTAVLQDPDSGAIVKIIENPESGERDFYIEPKDAKVNLQNLKPIYSVTAFQRKGSKDWVIGEPEWFSECVRSTDPWRDMPNRMLSHKSFIQAARKAFGIGGIYDEDEARDIERTGEAGPARGVIDAPRPEDDGEERQALGAPVTAGKVEDHTGHDDETGAAEEAAANLASARPETEPEPEPKPAAKPQPPQEPAPEQEQPDLPSATDDPGIRRLGDINKSIYARTLRSLHAIRTDSGYSEDEFKKMYKARYKVGSMTRMTMNQANELRQWLKDNPKPPEETDAAPPAQEAEAPSTETGAQETETETKEEDETHREKYLEAMREYQQMLPSDVKQVLQDDFMDRDLGKLNLEELKRFNKRLEDRMEPSKK